MAMWMPYQSFVRQYAYVYLVLLLVLIPLVSGGTIPYCYPPGKKVYRSGGCEECPKCVPGQFFNKTKGITEDRVFGSLDCYPCQECPVGKYSNERTWNQYDGYTCYIHKNCERRGRVVKIAGTNRTNTVCGECRKGYISEDWPILDDNSYCFPCSAKDKDKSACQDLIRTVVTAGPVIPVDPRPVNPGDSLNPANPHDPANPGDPVNPGQPESPYDATTQGTDPKNQSEGGSNSFPVIVWVLVAVFCFLIVVLVIAVLAYFCCGRIHQQDNGNEQKGNQETKAGLLAAVGDDLDLDCPKAFSSISTGASGVTSSTDDQVEMKFLTAEERQTALSIRLKNDDSYVKAVGNADSSPYQHLRRDKMRSLMFSLGLKQVQIDEIGEEHLISYLNKFIQCKGKQATLISLYDALIKHNFNKEWDALVIELRKKTNNSSAPKFPTAEQTSSSLNKDLTEGSIPLDMKF